MKPKRVEAASTNDHEIAAAEPKKDGKFTLRMALTMYIYQVGSFTVLLSAKKHIAINVSSATFP